MKILYQLVAPMEKTLGAGEIARRAEFLKRYAAADVSVAVRSVGRGTASIESAYDAAIVVPAIIESVRDAVEEGFEAVIVGCFSDPGLDALREIVRVPVVGPGMSAIHLALQLGDRFSIISPNANGSGHSGAYVRQLGLASRYASTRGMGLTVIELARGDASALDRITERGRVCVEVDGADVLVLGCMSMAFLDVTEELTARIGVPVVSPVVAALKTAEMMLCHGVAHSVAGWPAPPEKPVLERGAQ
jgi:allantoin racemase